MGYRVKRIHALEDENLRLTQENERLKTSEEYWHKEAIKWATKLGENKIRIRKILNKFGIPEGNIKDNEIAKFIEG